MGHWIDSSFPLSMRHPVGNMAYYQALESFSSLPPALQGLDLWGDFHAHVNGDL